MDAINDTISLYYLCWAVGVLAAYVTGILLRKRYGLGLAKAITYISLDMAIGTFLIFALAWVFTGGNAQGGNYVRMVWCIGLYGWLFAKLFKDPYEKIWDYLIIIGSVLFGFARIGCVFVGCCHGYPSSWGIYSKIAETVCFPIQIIEIAVSFTLALIMLWMSGQKKCQGKLYPYFLIMFGGSRFFLEFLRDNLKLIWGISELALHAFACFVLGFVLLWLHKREKQRRSSDEKR